MARSHFIFLSVIIKDADNLSNLVKCLQVNKDSLWKLRSARKSRAEGSLVPPTCGDVLPVRAKVGQTLPSFVPFIMLTLSSGTKKGDSSNTS